MDNITDEEKAVVEELRRRTINDVTPKMLEDESMFYRFAKARDFNIKEAETMLRKHIAWRKEYEIETILTDYQPPEVLLKYACVSLACFDKDGCVVRYHDLGRMDTIGLSTVVKKTEMMKYMVYCIEKDKKMMIQKANNGLQLGKPILSPIYEFEGLTYAKAVSMKALQSLAFIVRTFLDNFPEHLNTVTVINAPFYFTWMYNALKPILPATVIQKVRVYGTDGWKDVLLETINADDLPAFLGGNKTDPDGNPLCETFILRGQTVPKTYHRQKSSKKLALESNVEKVSLMPFSKEEITFTVKEENSYLEWEFETMSRDIDFSLIYRGGGFEHVELIPKQRIDTSIEPEKGCFKCEKVGSYAIVFDNSYSWFHSKEVHYRAEVKCPKSSELFKPT